MVTPPSLDLFVSHSSADADLVEPLVDLLQDALGLEPSRIRATSIDGYRLAAGIPFEEALRRETRDASAFIGVISPASLKSTYVAFELGSRWGANRHLVPLLTPEVAGDALEGPLATLNAMRIDDRAQMQQLIDDLADELNIKARPPHQYVDGDKEEDSGVNYAHLVAQFDVLMEVQERVMEQPNGAVRTSDLEKLESQQESITLWIRENRLRADPEIAKDADKLLGMLRDERRAFMGGNGVAFAEDPRTVFERLVERVRSKRRRA